MPDATKYYNCKCWEVGKVRVRQGWVAGVGVEGEG